MRVSYRQLSHFNRMRVPLERFGDTYMPNKLNGHRNAILEVHVRDVGVTLEAESSELCLCRLLPARILLLTGGRAVEIPVLNWTAADSADWTLHFVPIWGLFGL